MRLYQIAALCCCLVLGLTNCSQPEEQTDSFVIMGYYVPGEKAEATLSLDKLTHVIFSFTEVIDNEMEFKNPEVANRLRQLVEQKKKFPDLKVMVACGGWGGSAGFSEMAANPDKRKRFVKSVVQFIKDYDLDGLDMDWEYPGLPGNDNPHQPEDKENFTALMKELREGMNSISKTQVLSFASAGWERYYDHVELDEVMKYADFMNVMTYDQTGGYAAFTGHHANLMSNPGTGEYGSPRSADHIIRYCIEQGVSPEQIVIGGAFYGRSWRGVPPQDNGLHQPAAGAWKSAIVYSEIARDYEGKHGFERFWDEKAQAPYLYRAADSLFITYEDATSLVSKTNYALENQLGGIMFWQLTQDSESGNLLNAIYKAAHR